MPNISAEGSQEETPSFVVPPHQYQCAKYQLYTILEDLDAVREGITEPRSEYSFDFYLGDVAYQCDVHLVANAVVVLEIELHLRFILNEDHPEYSTILESLFALQAKIGFLSFTIGDDSDLKANFSFPLSMADLVVATDMVVCEYLSIVSSAVERCLPVLTLLFAETLDV